MFLLKQITLPEFALFLLKQITLSKFVLFRLKQITLSEFVLFLLKQITLSEFELFLLKQIILSELVKYSYLFLIRKKFLNIILVLFFKDKKNALKGPDGKPLTDKQLRALKAKQLDEDRRRKEKEEREERLKRKRGGESLEDDITKKLRELKDNTAPSGSATPSKAGGQVIVPTPKGAKLPPAPNLPNPILPTPASTPKTDQDAAARALKAAAAAAAKSAVNQTPNSLILPPLPPLAPTPGSIKAQIEGMTEEEIEAELQSEFSDLGTDDEDSDIEQERMNRKERQDRHKRIKKKYTQAVKEGATVIIRSSDRSDLQTRDFQIINLGVTKFLEERMMRGEQVGVGNCGMYQGMIWYEVKNQETIKLFEKYTPDFAPPEGKSHKYVLGPRDDMHKVFTCFIDQYYWDQRDVLLRRLKLFTPDINHKVTNDDGSERLAHVKIISGGQDKQAEIRNGGFIVRLELEECLIDVLVNKSDRGMEGRVRFTAGSSVELQGNAIEKLVKERQDRDEQEDKLKRERRERIREKKRRRIELLKQSKAKK